MTLSLKNSCSLGQGLTFVFQTLESDEYGRLSSQEKSPCQYILYTLCRTSLDTPV